jgi:hypothetical protein
MPTVHYMREQQGYRPFTNPRPLAGLRGLGHLGQAICLDQSQNTVSCSDPNCTFGDCGSTAPQQTTGALCLDDAENQVPCDNPECAYGDCVSPTSPSTAPSPAGGAPTGAILVYQATISAHAWTSEADLVAGMSGVLNPSGLRIVSQSTGTASGVGNFTVQLQLQVTGSGFAQPQDVQSIADHAVYVQSGSMPLSSSIGVVSTPSTSGVSVPASSLGLSTLNWNEIIIGVAALAIGGLVVAKIL